VSIHEFSIWDLRVAIGQSRAIDASITRSLVAAVPELISL
jgi:hypothetical protein